MASVDTPVRPKKNAAQSAAKPRRVTARTENAEELFDEVAALERFKALMHKFAGKLKFDGAGE